MPALWSTVVQEEIEGPARRHVARWREVMSSDYKTLTEVLGDASWWPTAARFEWGVATAFGHGFLTAEMGETQAELQCPCLLPGTSWLNTWLNTGNNTREYAPRNRRATRSDYAKGIDNEPFIEMFLRAQPHANLLHGQQVFDTQWSDSLAKFAIHGLVDAPMELPLLVALGAMTRMLPADSPMRLAAERMRGTSQGSTPVQFRLLEHPQGPWLHQPLLQLACSAAEDDNDAAVEFVVSMCSAVLTEMYSTTIEEDRLMLATVNRGGKQRVANRSCDSPAAQRQARTRRNDLQRPRDAHCVLRKHIYDISDSR